MLITTKQACSLIKLDYRKIKGIKQQLNWPKHEKMRGPAPMYDKDKILAYAATTDIAALIAKIDSDRQESRKLKMRECKRLGPVLKQETEAKASKFNQLATRFITGEFLPAAAQQQRKFRQLTSRILGSKVTHSYTLKADWLE